MIRGYGLTIMDYVDICFLPVAFSVFGLVFLIIWFKLIK